MSKLIMHVFLRNILDNLCMKEIEFNWLFLFSTTISKPVLHYSEAHRSIVTFAVLNRFVQLFFSEFDQ